MSAAEFALLKNDEIMNQVMMHTDKKPTSRTRHHSSDRLLEFDYHAMTEQQRQKLEVE